MSDFFKFVRAVVCDGRACASDEVVAAEEIPAGTLESCLRMGHCVPCDGQGVDLSTAGPAPDLTSPAAVPAKPAKGKSKTK